MASSKPIPCGPCQEGKVNTKADIWCYNCEEGLCSACSGHHKRFRGTRDHKTIDIKSYKPSIRAIKTECDKHGQQLNLYCPSHLMPCCDECISTNHSKCTGIKSLAAVVEKTKIEKSKESVEKEIYSILHVLDKMVNNKSINIQTGEQQCENIKKSFHKIREKINKHLDHLEKKLCQETDNLWDQETSTARDFITEIEKKKTNLQKMQEHLLSVTTQSSKLQSFLGLHQIEQQQLGSLESIGEVTVVKTETALNRETSVRRKAQVQSRVQSNINNMTMNIETKIEINIEKLISDMICLMDGRVIVVEQCGGKVNLLTSDGKLQKQLPIPGLIDDEIRIIDLEGNTLKSIQVESESDLDYLVYCNDRVIYSDYNGKAVYCYDESSKQIWQYTQDLSGPWGLCTDSYGNIIVADCNSNRIIVISKDGQESKVLISEEDGLENPRCICFKHNESSGFICD
ncbi:TRIM56 [Mytilus edulis]|uniref:TRIM56 n=1 Tax=Mytilus edulis TaxID=6550 RepID=A0A8S3QFQ1_MYTED|nr:TRIM56 [Mytilus edulis]